MGAWGCNVEDNDMALDFKADCQDLMMERGYTLYDAVDFLLKCKGYDKHIDAILMVGKMEFEEYGEVKHIDIVRKALSEEMTIDNLSNWASPRNRLEALTKLKRYIKI